MFEFIQEKYKDKDIILFGTGTLSYYLLQNWDIENKIICCIDNNEKRQKKGFMGLPVYAADKLLKYNKNTQKIIVAADASYLEISNQLKKLGLKEDIDYTHISTSFFKGQGYFEFTTAIGCPVVCTYCPQGEFINTYLRKSKTKEVNLSLDNFKTMIDKINKSSIISFGGTVEPFKNKSCTDMIIYSLDRGNMVTINTTLVGITLDDYIKILNNKNIRRLMEIRLHIPDSEGLTKFDINDEYLKVLKYVIDNPPHENSIKISCHGKSEDSAISHIIKSEKTEIINDRAGSLDEAVDLQANCSESGAIICSSLSMNAQEFRCGYILPDGNVLPCSMDWQIEHIIGNLINDGLEDVFSSSEYKRFLNSFDDDSIYSICRKCGYSIAKKCANVERR